MFADFKGKDGADGFWKCEQFSCDDAAEELNASDPETAIEERLDAVLGLPEEDVLATLNAAFGKTVTVYGYTRMEIGRGLDADRILERVLEDLDEEHGPPDGTEPTQAMKAAAETFAYVVRSEYVVWGCDRTHSATVNIEAWVREHRPDWLEPVK